VIAMPTGSSFNPFEVVPDALRIEAKKWRERSERMARVKSSVDRLELNASSFFIAGPFSAISGMAFEGIRASIHSGAYEDFHESMKTTIGGAVSEFEQLGGALEKIADEYEKVDASNSAELEKTHINTGPIFNQKANRGQ
jgi:uncharacterized protein YukE